MGGTIPYEYNPVGARQVRLVKFVGDASRTSVVLQAFSVDQELPRYQSISYTWASEETGTARTFALEIDGRMLPVLDSLQPFIQTLRAKNKLVDGTWWWIDSICIDQSNLKERAAQVQLINLIYRQAELVVVWLGEQSSDSDLAISFIKFLDKTHRRRLSVRDSRSLLQTDRYRAQWTALRNLLSRKWWSRIWTVQEFVLAPNVSFWCGMDSVCRVAVCLAILMADRCPSVGIKETLAFTHANHRRRALMLYKRSRAPGSKVNLSLAALTAYFACMDATDDRDRLYGLQALAMDSDVLPVSYAISLQEVYMRFTRSFIERYDSLDIICLASLYGASTADSSLPSWVPSWQKRATIVVPSMVSQSCHTHIGNLRAFVFLDVDPAVRYSASKNRPPVYSFEGSALLARGVVIDVVDGLTGSSHSDMVQSSLWSPTSSTGHLKPVASAIDILTSVCRSLALDRKDRYMRFDMPVADFSRDFINLLTRIVNKTNLASSQDLQEWFNRNKLLRIHGRTFESILHNCPQANAEPEGPPPNEDEYYHDTIFGRFYDTVVRMSFRLMVSRDGRVGMATERARKGDLICVLFGCSVPVLLRQADDGHGFRLVGECYLDGCMNGSAVEQPGLGERTFVIH